ncbi:hypothetical protein ACKWTF_002748 [Chironomus riparius]
MVGIDNFFHSCLSIDKSSLETTFTMDDLKSFDISAEKIETPITEFLRNKTIFLTGGNGFVGKILIEKLLRCDVKKIFIMMRPKKQKNLHQRFEVLIEDPIFSKISKDGERYFKKLCLIYGDLQEIRLGISENDERMIMNEAEIFYHVAADVRFDENLRESIEINVRGTREVISLAKRTRNLNVFIYVSTAFSTPSFNVHEKFYNPNIDPNLMIKVVENLKKDEDIENFEILARRIIQPYPNTYCYTKALAEQIVKECAKDLNAAVIRPSIITATYLDPIQGYTDNVYGLNGVLVGAGVGVLRIFRINNKLKSNIVPADYVINLILAISFYTMTLENNFNYNRHIDAYAENANVQNNHDNGTEHQHEFHLNKVNGSGGKDGGDDDDNKIKVYNFSSSDDNCITWADVKHISSSLAYKNPAKRALWIITYNTTQSKIIVKILRILYHIIPAYLFDMILYLNNKKPRLLKLYRKVDKFAEVIEFFTNNQWHFDDNNVIRLWNSMTSYDKEHFPFNLWSIEWEDFFAVYTSGLRLYIMKETLDTLKDARKKYRKMTIIHYSMLFCIYSVCFYCGYKILNFYGLLDDIPKFNISSNTEFTFMKYDST